MFIPRTHSTGRLLLWFALASAASLTGCASSSNCVHRGAGDAPMTAPEFPEVERGQIAPDLSALESIEVLPVPSTMAPATAAYRSLTHANCQCLAALMSPGGNQIAGEKNAVQAQGTEDPEELACMTWLRRSLLDYAEVGARDQSAAQALSRYYRLARIEHRLDVMHESIVQTRQAQETLDKLIDRGLEAVTDDGTLLRQYWELESQREEADLERRELNVLLRHDLAVDPMEGPWLFWPDTPLAVDPAPIDVETAIATGLSQRAELGLLRVLLAHLTPETLPVARATLGSANALLGLQPPTACGACIAQLLHCGTCDSCAEVAEVAARRRQLQQQLADREQAVISEVRQAAAESEARLAQVLYAREALASWQRRVAELEERIATGDATFLDVSAARLEILRAKDQLVTAVVGWHLAQVQLSYAQGLLAAECGFGPHAAYGHGSHAGH